MNVVIRSDDGACSLLVDKIGDVQEIHPDNLEPPPETLKGKSRKLIRGTYKMKDRIFLILDTERAMNVTSNDD